MSMTDLSAPLLDDDAPFGCDTKAAQSRENYLQDPSHNVGEPQLLDYRNSGQDFKQSFDLLPNCVSEDDPRSTQMANHDTPSLLKQSSEIHVQPGSIGFGKSNVQKNFVRKLFDMLSDESAKPYIYWNPDGKSFVVEQQEEFSKKVLKRYIKTEHFQSFIRQLNMYDFHRINRRAQRGIQAQTTQFVFSHQKFQRDYPELLEETKRKGIEPQDAPPSYETLSSVGMPGFGMPTSTQPLVAAQPELRDILIQMEFQRLRSRIAYLEEENNNLKVERDALKASLRSSSMTTYRPLYGGNASNKALELNRSCDMFERDYHALAPEPTETPVLFQGFTGITPQNNTNQAAGPSHVSLNSTPIPIRRRLSNAPAPDMGTNNQAAPQQSRGQGKARPSSWYENVGQWLGLPGVGSHPEASPSAAGNAFPQNAQATHNTNHGNGALGGRGQPALMANKRQQH